MTVCLLRGLTERISKSVLSHFVSEGRAGTARDGQKAAKPIEGKEVACKIRGPFRTVSALLLLREIVELV